MKPSALIVALVLMAAVAPGAWAQESAATESPAPAINIGEAIETAESRAEGVSMALEALDSARTAASDAVPWKGSAISVNASYEGDLVDPAPPKGAQDPYAISGSLTVPILESLSVSGSARLDGPVSASLSWFPLTAARRVSDAAYQVALARVALDDARRQARLDAMNGFVQVLSVEAAANAAWVTLDRARAGLAVSESDAKAGELSALALARARAAVPRAEAAWNKALALALDARATLAKRIGSPLGDRIQAGAPLDASFAADVRDEGWQAPAYREGKAVLQARIYLEKARNAAEFTGSGPISIGASLDSDGAVSLRGSVSLDWKQVGGSVRASRQEAVRTATEDLDSAMETERTMYRNAVFDAEIARLSLLEAVANLDVTQAEAEQARILSGLGELLPQDLADAETAFANAVLELELARLELARARLAFE